MKKFLALLLAMVMVIGLVACGKKDDKPADTTAANGGDTTAAADSTTAAETTEAKELEPVTLKMWFHGSTVTPEASEKVMAELNAYLADKINVTLEPIWGTWGDFDTNVPTAMAGGDDVDIYFTCNWSANEYNKYARDGYWVKLDGMLDQYAPELKSTIPQPIWDCAKTAGVDGVGVYAVPGLKDTATQNCWDVNGTLLAELGYDVDAVCKAGLDYYSPEFEEMLQKAKDAKGGDFYPLLIEPAVLERMVTCTSIVTGDLQSNMLSYYYDPADPSKDIGSSIVNKFATEEYKKFATKTFEYAQKGFISPSCQQSATANDYRTATQTEGAYLFGTQSYAFGCELDFSKARGIDVRMVPASAPYMDATSGQGAMMAISAVSKNPERALMFLNLLNTDPAVMTFVNYGVEGYTYEKNADGTIKFIDEGRKSYSPWTNGVGNIRILPPTDAQGADFWGKFEGYYDTAKALPCGGFVFNSSEFESEAGALGNVLQKYSFNLNSGAVDPADPDKGIDALLAEMETAGASKFVEAANTQLNAYLGK